MDNTSRIGWIDVWKGMLISLVVLGHVGGIMCHYGSADTRGAFSLIYKFIYLFHMPAFFAVAGYLWKAKCDMPYRIQLKKRMERLVVPYFFWGVFSAGVFILTAAFAERYISSANGYYTANMFKTSAINQLLSILHAGDWPNGNGFRCNSVLWFLPCMFMTLVVYDLLSRVTINEKRFDLTLFCVSIVAGAVTRFYAPRYLPWGLSKMSYMMIFFTLGRLFKEWGLVRKVNMWLLLVAWALFVLAAWLYPNLWHGYWSWKWYCYSTTLAAIGCALSCWTAGSMSGRVVVLLSKLGIASMGIMLVHKFFILPFQVLSQKFVADQSFLMLFVIVLVVAMIVSGTSYWTVLLIKRFAPWIVGEKEKNV